MKKKILIAGAGGFGLEVAEYLLADSVRGYLSGYEVCGALDDRFRCGDDFIAGLKIVGGIAGYQPQADEYIVLALGQIAHRVKLGQALKQYGARFFSYVHSSCYVSPTVELGEGVVVAPNCIINARTRIGDFAVVNVFSSIGHGADVGAYSVLSPYAALNGDAKVGARCFLGTRATVFPGVKLGDDCTVDSHSYVKKDAANASIISHRGEYRVDINRLIK